MTPRERSGGSGEDDRERASERTQNARERARGDGNARLSRPGASALLDGIDLLVFDKDGTLIEFHLMWGNWVDELASRLEAASGLQLRERLYPLLGVARDTGLVHAHGLLAATPMSRIREVVEADVAEAGASPDDAAAAVAAGWHAPDPVALAHPVTDLRSLLDRLRGSVGTFAVATSDDRGPTERTLVSLGVRDAFADIVCADDGIRTKPSADPVLHLCRSLDIDPGRTAVVGDSPADLLMARGAGAARAIGVLTGVGDRASLEPYADAVLGSIEDLLTP